MTGLYIWLSVLALVFPVLLYILIRTSTAALYRSRLDYEKEKFDMEKKESIKNGR